MTKELIGKTIYKIYMTEKYLVFVVSKNASKVVAFGVEGDCCSTSYFHDFIGVKNILGKKVVDFKRIGLGSYDKYESNNVKEMKKEGLPTGEGHFHNFRTNWEGTEYYELEYEECVKYYGYKIIVEDGKSAVFAFRNSSNGCYGGNMEMLDSTTENPLKNEFELGLEDYYLLKNDYLGD